jgi:uncharacterized membrane protein
MPASQPPPVRPSLGFPSLGLAQTSHSAFTEFLGINDLGDIAATAGEGKALVAYVGRAPYRSVDFKRKALPGAVTTIVTALNNAGVAAGFYKTSNGNIASFTKHNGIWTRYRDPAGNTEYLGINDAGLAVGFYTDRRGVEHAFERDAKTGKVLDVRPAGSLSVVASAINERGEIVGYMTTSRRVVKGFLLSDGRFTIFSYPGASATRPLGINKQGDVVGSYDDASGQTHGFILHTQTASLRWNTFGEPVARSLTVLTGINARGDLVGYYRDAKSHHPHALFQPGAMSGPSIPLVIPVWGLGGTSTDTDPGAIPDQHLFAVILENWQVSSPKLAQNCPGVGSNSTCQPYKYINFSINHCDTPVALAAYQWADANDEGAFQHNYPYAESSSNRLTYQETPNPNCQPHGQNAAMRMNLSDSAFNAYLYQNVWNGSDYGNDFPAPYGAMEDQVSVFGGIVVGGSGQVSTEYGSGTKPSGFANQIGTSPYHEATDWERAIGIFINGACAATCLNMAINGVATGSGDVGPCNIIRNGHCHVQYQSGDVDNQAAIDNICKMVTGGNLKYFQAERPIFMGRFGYGFLDSQTMTVEINTAANLYSHTSDGCATTKIADIETSYGLGGLGDVTGGHRVRLAALAYRWLVANPSTGIPDRVISYQYTEGGTRTEVPYFFEDTLVPYGAETAVPKYVWNGRIQTTGGGCPSANGDTGGAVSLLSQCVGSAGIYCQQYQHLYINGADHGNAAACLNTSSTTENIVSSWFKHDPISSYSYELALQGGEMTSVWYRGVSGGKIALTTCTNTTYCTAPSYLAAQVAPFKGDGSDQLCGPCGVILLKNK